MSSFILFQSHKIPLISMTIIVLIAFIQFWNSGIQFNSDMNWTRICLHAWCTPLAALPSSGSYSVLVPWFGSVSWVLLRPTSEIFADPPRAPEVAVHSAHWNRGYSLFLLLASPQPRPVHSRWLAPLCGMGFLWRNDCSPWFCLTHSTLLSKLFFLAVRGSGALLSSNVEKALYKSP